MAKEKKNELSLEGIHAALLGILIKFDEICKEHGIEYSIAYGTLIGAVRHKGFIPWDDDVDVVMTRPEYERFYAMVKSGEIDLGERYLLSEDRGEKAFYPFLKLMDRRYPIKRWSQREVPYLYVDIFPLDGAPKEEKALEKARKKRLRYSAILALARWAVPEKKWMLILRALGFPFYLGCALYGMPRAVKKANENALSCAFEESENCSLMCFDREMWLLPKECFTRFCDIQFEGHTFRAIEDYDRWLTSIYGDYMTPPPENKRMKHNLRVIDEGENIFRQKG